MNHYEIVACPDCRKLWARPELGHAFIPFEGETGQLVNVEEPTILFAECPDCCNLRRTAELVKDVFGDKEERQR